MHAATINLSLQYQIAVKLGCLLLADPQPSLYSNQYTSRQHRNTQPEPNHRGDTIFACVTPFNGCSSRTNLAALRTNMQIFRTK